jgi:hypothetical protein
MEDAMYVALHIGIPYLWIDRYCILQDDANDKHEAIRNMDAIYQGAILTIVACGSGPHEGLPGVRNTPGLPGHVNFQTRTVRHDGPASTDKLQGFIRFENPRYEISRSKWNTCGWTYQEMFLSRRCLVFTESQIYFQCPIWTDNDVFRERDNCIKLKAWEEGNDLGYLRMAVQAFPTNNIGSSTIDLYSRLHDYYKRVLWYNTDIICQPEPR